MIITFVHNTNIDNKDQHTLLVYFFVHNPRKCIYKSKKNKQFCIRIIINFIIYLLFEMLPVSLHVLDAGDGGGGISILSAVSLLGFLPDELKPLVPWPAGSLTLSGNWDGTSLKVQESLSAHAAFCSCPTLGTPATTVKPNAPAWYIGLFFIHT